ncbi:hypothetical protein PFISCL1PPCAC_20697, partial [Pristionchus fissidentatus]
ARFWFVCVLVAVKLTGIVHALVCDYVPDTEITDTIKNGSFTGGVASGINGTGTLSCPAGLVACEVVVIKEGDAAVKYSKSCFYGSKKMASTARTIEILEYNGKHAIASGTTATKTSTISTRSPQI